MKGFLASVAMGFSLLSMPAWAADKGSADEAVAMVKKAAAMIKAEGKEKAFAAFADAGNKDFHDRDLYVFVYDLNGVNLAHGNNPKMVGKNLLELKDQEGKPLIRQMVDVAKTKGKGWVDYKWPNPVTKAIEAKSSYVEKVDDMLVGSGIYK
ncbi:cache domain-containing protein [Massilia eburnea]|nr:cache domain-containing protein [Massilia eburnea]